MTLIVETPTRTQPRILPMPAPLVEPRPIYPPERICPNQTIPFEP